MWAAAPVCFGLLALVTSVALAVLALVPREYLTLGIAYVERLQLWSQFPKPPEHVRGEAISGVVEAIALERRLNERKGRAIRRAFALLLVGLVLVAVEAATLAARSVWA